jgi:hypothetical protein
MTGTHLGLRSQTWGTRWIGFWKGDGLEHEGLGEEGAADRGLLFDGADAEGRERRRADEAAGVEEEDGGLIGFHGGTG